MFRRHLTLQPFQRNSRWRKVAIGSWGEPFDPSIHGTLKVDATRLLQVIEQYRQRGIRLTPTVIAAKAAAKAIEAYPAINGVLRWGRIYQRNEINIFLQVASDDTGEDLSGTVIAHCADKSLAEITAELQAKVTAIRNGDDQQIERGKKTMAVTPGLLMRPALRAISFILYSLNLWSPWLGVPRDPFGGAAVSSVGSLGIAMETVFPPLIHYCRVPMMLAVGKIEKQPWVENDQVVVRPVLTISATLDHRYVDGIGGGKLLNAFRSYLLDPH